MKKPSTAALLAGLVLIWTTIPARAEDVPVCAMSRDEFVAAAFPDNEVTAMHGGKLLKYASPPILVVLAPQARPMLDEQISLAFEQIRRDGLVKPFQASFKAYGTFADAQKIIQQSGNANTFVLVAARPDDSTELTNFRSILLSILHGPEAVEGLITRSEAGKGFVSRNRMNWRTGEIESTAVLVSPKYADAQVGMMTYLAYYMSLSPNAFSTDTLAPYFSWDSELEATMTDFARRFFQVFADDRVKFGMTRGSFVECAE